MFALTIVYSNIYLATDVFVPNLYVSLHSNTDDTEVQSSVRSTH